MRLPYLHSLDGVRGLAVLLVIAFHAEVLGIGWAGVQLFFVLSGFLITRILLAEKDQPVGPYLRGFYRRRAARIFPLYFAYLALLGGVFLATGAPSAFGRFAPSLFTYTFNLARLRGDWEMSPFFTHFWSLAIEEQFYLVWPLLVWALPRRWLKAVIVLAIAIAPATRWLLSGVLKARGFQALDIVEAVNAFTLSQVDALAVGAAIAAFELERIGRHARWLFAGGVAIAMVAGGAQLWALLGRGAPVGWSSLGYPQPMQADAQVVWGTSLLNLAFGALILVLIAGAWRWRFFEARWLREVGKVSYGMYVAHLPAIRIVHAIWDFRAVGWLGAVAFVGVTVAIFGLAWVSYRFFEGPILAWARRERAEAPAVALS